MAIKAAMWVHGTVVEAENPVHSIARKGWGTHFVIPPPPIPAGENWFHIPIPPPVILDDRRPKLTKVFVFFRTTDAKVDRIHFYDGPTAFKVIDDLNLQGEHSRAIDTSNS